MKTPPNEDPTPARQILDTAPQIMRHIRTQMRLAAKDSLTVPQFRILVQIVKYPRSNKEIAETIGITPATLTRLVDTLVSLKLVKRIASTHDRRQIQLTATAQGIALHARFQKQAYDFINQKIEKLTASEQQQLSKGLEHLSKIF